MKKILIGLFLLCSTVAHGQDIFLGVRLLQDLGADLGFTGDRIGFKVFGASDYHFQSTTDPKNAEFKDHTGERYHLVYGGGFMYRIAGDFWASLNAGYGWSGKYGWDEAGELYGSTRTVRGLDLGIDLMLRLDNYYISVGYDTMPATFKRGIPMNLVAVGVGMCF